MITHGSLFSGIGGFDLAAEWMGWENVFHCEWNEFPRKVLNYYWPNADSLEDICKTDFKKYENKISILTGGFPCQPFSQAGKRKGTNDERYLWHEMLRAISEIKPKYVIAENVFGITTIDGGMVFEQVCVDLENQGYEVQPFIIPACGKDAPHQRSRVFFIAYNKSYGWHKSRAGVSERSKYQQKGFEIWRQYSTVGPCKITTNTNSNRAEICKPPFYTNKTGQHAQYNFEQVTFDTNRHRWNAKQYELQNFKESQQEKCRKQQPSRTNSSQSWWRKFPVEHPVCSGNDGLSDQLAGITFRKWKEEAVKGFGNAVVPQIAKTIFEVIEKIEQ